MATTSNRWPPWNLSWMSGTPPASTSPVIDVDSASAALDSGTGSAADVDSASTVGWGDDLPAPSPDDPDAESPSWDMVDTDDDADDDDTGPSRNAVPVVHPEPPTVNPNGLRRKRKRSPATLPRFMNLCLFVLIILIRASRAAQLYSQNVK